MTYQLNKINKIIINEDFAIVDLDETIVLMNEKSGEFLRLNLAVSSEIMKFLLDPLPLFEDGFNEKRLGERLVELGLITNSMLDHALELQSSSGIRLGEILQDISNLSPEAADFFSKVRVAENGEFNI